MAKITATTNLISTFFQNSKIELHFQHILQGFKSNFKLKFKQVESENRIRKKLLWKYNV